MNTIPQIFNAETLEQQAQSFADEITRSLDVASLEVIQAHGQRLHNGIYTNGEQYRDVTAAFNAFANQSTRYTRFTRHFKGYPERHNAFEDQIAVLTFEQSGQVQS